MPVTFHTHRQGVCKCRRTPASEPRIRPKKGGPWTGTVRDNPMPNSPSTAQEYWFKGIRRHVGPVTPTIGEGTVAENEELEEASP